MGGLLIFLFIILPILKGAKRDERRSDVFKIFFGIYFLFAVLGAVFHSPIAAVAIIALVLYLFIKAKKKKESNEREQKYGWEKQTRTKQNSYGGTYQNTQSYSSRADAGTGRVFSVILPKQVSKRRKIVQDFNRKYDLYLTPEQVQGIVDSTYMSETWKREVEAMAGKYETIYEWFQGSTKWLRAYLYAFHVQDVTSDFSQQERIVTTAFEEIMRYSDSLSNLSVSERIKEINSKFYTNFDDVTYMIAYRFLESKGLFHTLEVTEPSRDDKDLDDLMEKYRTMPSE